MFNKNSLIVFLVFLFVFNFIVWKQIVFSRVINNSEIYFFDVGQGDSQLVVLSGGAFAPPVKVLIDGGPSNKVIKELDFVLSPTDRYIDLVVLSHPQYDHFAGLIDVFKRYDIGAFIYNGRDGEIAAFGDLKKSLEEKKIKEIILGQGDKIKYRDNNFSILSPSKDLLEGKELNDTSLVMKLESSGFKALFTGDIGFKVENYLSDNFDLDVDVLKVGHHGSKFSSGKKFLEKASPKVSAIEVGKNSYGHPTIQTLDNLAFIGSKIFRTDKDGIIKLTIINGEIMIFKRN